MCVFRWLARARFIGAKFVHTRKHKYAVIGSQCARARARVPRIAILDQSGAEDDSLITAGARRTHSVAVVSD